MLLSMTGFGEAHGQADEVAVSIELRTINSRYFKLNIRGPEGLNSLEPKIDVILKKHIKRGTVQLTLKIDREVSADNFRINDQVLLNYRRQLEQLGDKITTEKATMEPVRLDALLALPGVVDEANNQYQQATEYWPLIESTLVQALAHLSQMRSDEGKAMADDLASNCQIIDEQIGTIAGRTDVVVDYYRTRLTERMQKLLVDYDVTIEAADLAREVGLFAERCDISEEIVRLRSHLEQFRSQLESQEGAGRKLEFLTQEMFRETNTIGSKANDAEIAKHVIEIKAAIERMREMIQNVE